VLAKAHEVRNVAEYEGHFDADATMLRNLIEAAEAGRVVLKPENKAYPVIRPKGELEIFGGKGVTGGKGSGLAFCLLRRLR